jgi:glyceraldehyde 3-phosphate dehydrogenase
MRIAVNGFGRIGRQVVKIILDKYAELEIVAINDITSPATLAHLYKYDSNYGRVDDSVQVADGNLVIQGKTIKVLAERDPANLPWKSLGVDLVIESTGLFTKREGAQKHLQAGARKVVISAPAKGEDLTVVLGVNHDQYDPDRHHIVSNASCTTNCLAPAAKVVHDALRIRKAMMTTVHSYTNDQRILDLPHEDLRRARAGALNIIPTTTGAARAVSLVIPDLAGRFDGFALRVPTPTVSIVDFVATVEKPTTREELNRLFREAAAGPLKGILEVSEEPLVSMDFKGHPASSIVDLLSTMVLDDMVKVVAWYDNEWGYSSRLADLVHFMATRRLAVQAQGSAAR